MSITLMTNNSFHYDEYSDLSKITPDLQNYNQPAIEIIKKIISLKLKSNNIENKLYFLEGRTGSGKSTYLVSELYKAFILTSNKLKNSISVVEPKVILTQSNALNICRNNSDIVIGKNIGYLSGQFKLEPTESKNIVFMTTEIFKQKLLKVIKNPTTSLNSDIVILDEVHILDLPMISLLNVVYNFIKSNSDNINKIPLFIMTSATIDIKSLVNYFSNIINKTSTEIYKDPLMIGYVIGKRNYEVKHSYIDKKLSDNIIKLTVEEQFVELAKWINAKIIPMSEDSKSKISNIPCKDILVFLPVTKPYEIIGNELKKIIKLPSIFVNKTLDEKTFNKWRIDNKGNKRIVIMGYSSNYSSLSNNLLKFSIDPDIDAQQNEIKIILTTPAIETGKTIATLYICIDTGLQFSQTYIPLNYNPGQFYGQLNPISKNSIIQRLGRVGREAPGISICFYTEQAYNMLTQNTYPDNLNTVSLASTYIDNFHIIKQIEANNYLTRQLDLLRENNYIIPNSIDTLIRTGQDLINCLYLNLNSTYSNINFNSKSNSSIKCEPWLIYAKYLYYVHGYNLFEACFISRLNRKYLPVIITPSKFIPKFTLEVLKNYETYDDAFKNEIIDSISEAKKAVNTTKYDRINSPFIKLNI